MREFKVGDRVYDIITGHFGTVVLIDHNRTYPVEVEMDRNYTIVYAIDGRYYNEDQIRRLYHTNEKVEIKVKENKPKYRVVVRNFIGDLSISNSFYESLEDYNDGTNVGVAIELIKSTEC